MTDDDDDDDNAEARECGRESAGRQGALRLSFWERERYFCLRGWQRVSFSLGLMFAGVS